MQPQLVSQISGKTGLTLWKVKSTIELLSQGATIPFIARYRKEAIGSLDEVEVSDINKEYKRLIEITKRKETMLKVIEEQGKLTNEIKQRIQNCWESTALEDIYLPYKPKRQTRATKAREAGLEPMAKIIMKQQEQAPLHKARAYIAKEYPTPDDVILGAKDIIAEWVAESPVARSITRSMFERNARIYCKLIKGKEEIGQKYQDYFDFDEPLHRCPSHRLLAMRRGEKEGVLRVSIHPDKDRAIERLSQRFVKSRNDCGQLVKEAVDDAYKRLLAPSIETEFKNLSKVKADAEAIGVFVKNLRQLLLMPPLGQKKVLAIDPGFRSGCKVVCLDRQGKHLANKTVYPNPPQNQTVKASDDIHWLLDKYQIESVAIGNGTAGRETERWIKNIVGEEINVYLISEDGASIYSASELARAEFPDLDLTVRGAISIGRRLLDPLAELVKIDAKSIGVGQYQHDVDQKQLRESLDETVMSCVNTVGVNLNTASAQLLSYVSGLGKTGAENTIQFRQDNGAFTKREHIKKVKGIGARAYEQSAGFLRLPGASNPLDNSAVHPERYTLVTQMADDLSLSVHRLVGNASTVDKIDLKRYVSDEVGLPTLNDIVAELKKPGLDPRGEMVSFSFADHIRSLDDLETGMVLPGKITNVTKFGAFVNIGIKENGLVHVSQMADKFVSDPSEIVSLDQNVQVKVVSIDADRGRISLSMKGL